MDNETPAVPDDGNPSEETPPPPVPVFEHSNCEATIKRLTDDRDVHATALINAREELNRLRNEQIDGSDPRLASFWEKAQQLADQAGHCQVFDEIAEALGGPRREREYIVSITSYVTVPVSYSMTVMAPDSDVARELAEEAFSDMDASDLEDYASWYDADLDTYSVTSHAELN